MSSEQKSEHCSSGGKIHLNEYHVPFDATMLTVRTLVISGQRLQIPSYSGREQNSPSGPLLQDQEGARPQQEVRVIHSFSHGRIIM